MATAKDIVQRIKDEEIEWVDLRFTDPKGKWQHLSMSAAVMDEDALEDGLMFDGSSIAGWKDINESDMILKPDLNAVYVDPFSATPMISIFCNIIEPSDGQLYGRDPRSTATRAEAYLKPRPASVTRSMLVQSQSSSCSTMYASKTAMRVQALPSTMSNCRPTPAKNMTWAIWATAPAQPAATSQSHLSTAPWTSALRWFRPCRKSASTWTSTTTKWLPLSTSLASPSRR